MTTYRLRLQPRFLWTEGESFYGPVEWHRLPTDLQLELASVDQDEWFEHNLYAACDTVFAVVDSINPSPSQCDVRITHEPDNGVQAQCGDVYANRGHPVDLLHALEQRVDTGFYGYQWAHGVNEETERTWSRGTCTLVFEVVPAPTEGKTEA